MEGPRTSRRATLGLLIGVVAISYIDRVSVTHAIGPASTEFGWTPFQIGLILSAFSWGYVVAMMPGGLLVDRLGGRRAVIGGATCWSLISASAALTTGAWFLGANRFLLGVAEAPTFPAAASTTAHAFNAYERGRATALFDGGSYVGMAIGAPLVAFSIAYAGWRSGFLLASALTVVWLFASVLIFKFHRGFESSPVRDVRHEERVARVITLLRQRPIWCLGLGFFGYNYVKSFYLTWFALFLVQSLGLGTTGAGVAAIFPPLLAVVASVSVGSLTDRLGRTRREGDLGSLRVKIVAFAMFGSSLIAVVPYIHSSVAGVVVLSIAFASTISASPGIWALPGDLAPTLGWVGTIGGVVNTMSNIGGIVAPIVTGYLVQRSQGGYGLALAATGVVSLLSTATFLLGGKYKRLTIRETL